jgi:protein-export membrane protein SecD
MNKYRFFALLILVLGLTLGYLVFATEKGFMSVKRPFVLGLDLKGGTHLVYKADVSKLKESDISSSMESLRQVIEQRVNIFGVSEPLVQVEHAGFGNATNDERLIVELPGVTDITKAVAARGETPVLDFRLVNKNPSGTSTEELFIPTELTGRYLKRATLEFDQNTRSPLVSLQFNDEGGKIFANLTKNHVGDSMGIFLDGRPLSVPVIREEIPNGTAQISGNFTPEEAKALVRNLNYGALPVPIELISTQTIGASLGEAAVKDSVKAGLIGFAFVVFFLIVWYRLPGFLASVALSLYVAIMLAIFKLVPVTLTAAGLAGFILSIGMAVDANILIFERTKEELRAGKKLGEAIHEGFARAWTSIRDSNSSSMITAVILYWLGTSPVIKGFALVFFLGVLASMFTAITASRALLYSLPISLDRKDTLVRVLFGSGFSK